MSKRAKRVLIVLGLLAVVASLPFVVVRLLRPPRTEHSAEMFQGVSYKRQARLSPRPLMIHVVEIDLQTEGIGFLVTPADNSKGLEVRARTTSEFLEEFSLLVFRQSVRQRAAARANQVP